MFVRLFSLCKNTGEAACQTAPESDLNKLGVNINILTFLFVNEKQMIVFSVAMKYNVNGTNGRNGFSEYFY